MADFIKYLLSSSSFAKLCRVDNINLATVTEKKDITERFFNQLFIVLYTLSTNLLALIALIGIAKKVHISSGESTTSSHHYALTQKHNSSVTVKKVHLLPRCITLLSVLGHLFSSQCHTLQTLHTFRYTFPDIHAWKTSHTLTHPLNSVSPPFICYALDKMLLGRLVGRSLFGFLCSHQGVMQGDTHAWEEDA